MLKRLWFRVFLILLSVSAIALSSAFIVRELMVRDFRGFLEGQVEDRASWITTSLESTYEKYGVWANPEIIENTVWALMLGFEMKLYDADNSFVIGTDSAVNTLTPLLKKRIIWFCNGLIINYIDLNVQIISQEVNIIQVLGNTYL